MFVFLTGEEVRIVSKLLTRSVSLLATFKPIWEPSCCWCVAGSQSNTDIRDITAYLV